MSSLLELVRARRQAIEQFEADRDDEDLTPAQLLCRSVEMLPADVPPEDRAAYARTWAVRLCPGPVCPERAQEVAQLLEEAIGLMDFTVDDLRAIERHEAFAELREMEIGCKKPNCACTAPVSRDQIDAGYFERHHALAIEAGQ